MSTNADTQEQFRTEVLESDVPVLVDFWAEWCGPCRQVAPVLEEMSAAYEGRMKVVKIDIEKNGDVAAQLGVRGIPAMFLFRDGQVVSNRAGAASKAALTAWVEDAL